jgi:hypothetical protein
MVASKGTSSLISAIGCGEEEMREFLAELIGKKVDLLCLGMANLRGEVVRVDGHVLHLKDGDGRIGYVAIDKIVAVWEAQDNEHRAGFTVPK